ncbi:MFS transporter [Gallaecimonas xiamenensis]|uniref:Major facilitator superfamily drug efflux transporter n=1 Tax=Gallaecimonas xiamenensis 3-C-1 TaxID=745411 RepID=K2JNE2_9GAMM|nr:MFS transporter [Gallaecimonas xiamenensis]EKE76783.1 major facilitator superfamily drug efflux transporter [Gallaecimonas xiamenensis 3-C-1]
MPELGRDRSAKVSSVSVLVAVCLAVLVLPLSFSGGAIATPAIARDLGGGALELNWITNAFMLSFGSSLMAAGTLADGFGRKRLFTIGIVLFAVLSLAIGWAPNIIWLDVLRAIQGIAAAATLSGGSATLAQLYEGKARTRAFSLLGTSFGVGLAIGPVLAGLLLDRFGWRSVFLSGAIIGVLVLMFGIPRMKESRDPDAKGLDWLGTLTFTATLMTFTWGVLQAPKSGWSSPLVLLLLAGSVAFLAGFVAVEWRADRPMLDLSLFRYPRFVGVQLLPIATCYCYVVLLVLLPIRFIGIDEHSEIDAGLTMIALSAPMLVMPSLAASLTRWLSPGVISALGLLIAGLGLFLLSQVGIGQASQDAILPMIVIGLGTGLPWGLMDGLSVSLVPKERAGMATGIFSTTRVAGEGIALAMVSTFLASLTQARLSRLALENDIEQRPIPMAAQHLATGDMGHALALLPQVSRSLLADAYTHAFQMLMYLLIAITLVSAVVVFVVLGKNEKVTADPGSGEQPSGSDVAPPHTDIQPEN